MSRYLIGIDVGTYSSKGVLTDLDGNIIETATVAHDISIPSVGHVEHDADAVWWNDICLVSRALLAQSGVPPSAIQGVAISAIGPCLLPLDKERGPLRPAILYGVDVRAERQIQELERSLGADSILNFSNMGLTSQAVGPKICWLRENEPDLWSNTCHLVSANSYIVYRLTGQLWMDRHTAGHYMPLYNPKTQSWDARFAHEVCDISLLPKLAWAGEIAGAVTQDASQATGLCVGTPVTVGTVDALSEALSVGVVHPGDMMVMYGSTTFFIGIQNNPTPNPIFWSVDGLWPGQTNLAAGMSTTGSLTRWFRDGFCGDLPSEESYVELFKAAADVSPGANGLLVLPYFSGERSPINDPHARGVIAGLTLSHTRAHVFRAILEGVGFGIRHNLETFQTVGADVRRLVAVGGGAQSETWLQIISDITGAEQHLPQITIGASFGNAFLAGCATGTLTVDDLNRWVKPGATIKPRAQYKSLYDRLYAGYLNLYTQTKPTTQLLAAL